MSTDDFTCITCGSRLGTRAAGMEHLKASPGHSMRGIFMVAANPREVATNEAEILITLRGLADDCARDDERMTAAPWAYSDGESEIRAATEELRWRSVASGGAIGHENSRMIIDEDDGHSIASTRNRLPDLIRTLREAADYIARPREVVDIDRGAASLGSDLNAIRARIAEKPGMCEGGHCRPEWNWRSPECPGHWPWAVMPQLLAIIDHLQAELDEARRTGMVSSGGKSEARRERRLMEVERDTAVERAAGAVESVTETLTASAATLRAASAHIERVQRAAAVLKTLWFDRHLDVADLTGEARAAFNDLMAIVDGTSL